jgi:hypothetical protein
MNICVFHTIGGDIKEDASSSCTLNSTGDGNGVCSSRSLSTGDDRGVRLSG